MALPICINAHGITGLTLAPGIGVSSGDLLTDYGRPATNQTGHDGYIAFPASFIAMVTDQSLTANTIPVCRSCVLYDSDGPYVGHDLYLGPAGSIITKPGNGAAQHVGVSLGPYYASLVLQPDAAVIATSDLADLRDLLFAVTTNPNAFGGLGEMVLALRSTRTPN